MIDNYYKRYQLIFNPFTKNLNEYFFESKNFKELKYNLDYVIQTRGIGLITGNPGCGKTTALKQYLDTLPKHLYKVIYISMTTLTVREFYYQLGDMFSLPMSFKKNILVKEIKETICQYTDQKKILPIIVIDEANYLSNAILNDLKMLMNFDMDSRNKAVLIICGTPTLQRTLELTVHEPLNQRITAKVEFDELSESEAKTYIESKIEKAGSNLNIFTPDAIQGVINGSNGIPRLIDKIMDKTLMIGDKMNVDIINLDLVKKVTKTI